MAQDATQALIHELHPGEGSLTRDVPLTQNPRYFSLSGLYGDNFDRHANPDSIPFETYNQMRNDAVLRAGLILIKAPILACVQRATVECDEPRLKRFVEAVLLDSGQLYRLAQTSLRAQEFGVAFHEKVWDVQDMHVTYQNTDDTVEGKPEQFEDIAWSGPAMVYKDIKEVNPTTVLAVLRRIGTVDGKPGDGSFNGFVQSRAQTWLWNDPQAAKQQEQQQQQQLKGELNEVERALVGGVWVPPERAFVYTREKEYGNYWGVPRIRPAYAPYFWSQFILKLWMAWTERKVVPPRIVRHPVGNDQNGTDFSDVAIMLASMLDDNSAISVPNTTTRNAGDAQGGNFVWTFEELNTTDKTETFIAIADRLDSQKLRAIFVPERTFTSGPGFGLFSTDAQAHTDTFLMTEDAEALDWINAVNQYVVAPLVQVNFGTGTPACNIRLPGITDTHRELLREIIGQVLLSPGVTPLVDARRILDELGVPVTEEEAATLDAAAQGTRPPGFPGAASEAAAVPEAGAEPAPEEPAAAPAEAGAAAPEAGTPPAAGGKETPLPTDIPGNVVLDAPADEDAVSLAFDPDKWTVQPDPKALSGFAVYYAGTQKRLVGFAAAKVIDSWKKAQEGGGQADAKKSQSHAEAEQRRAQADQRREQAHAEAAQRRAQADQRREQAHAEAEQRHAEAEQRREQHEGKAEADKAARQAEAAQRKAEAEAKQAARAAAAAQRKAEAEARAAQRKADVAQAKAEREQTAASKKAAHDAKVAQHEAEMAAAKAQRETDRKQRLAAVAQRKAQQQQAQQKREQEHEQRLAAQKQKEQERQQAQQQKQQGALSKAQTSTMKADKNALQSQTAKMDSNSASKLAAQQGFKPTGVDGNYNDAVTRATTSAKNDPASVYSIVKTGNGYLTVSKAASDLGNAPSNVALTADADAPATLSEALMRRASGRLRRILRGKGV